jgi:hypothetical protein
VDLSSEAEELSEALKRESRSTGAEEVELDSRRALSPSLTLLSSSSCSEMAALKIYGVRRCSFTRAALPAALVAVLRRLHKFWQIEDGWPDVASWGMLLGHRAFE